MLPLSTIALDLPEGLRFSVESILGALRASVTGVWLARADRARGDLRVDVDVDPQSFL